MGFSMGGVGTWDIVCRRPDLFAAAVPVAGRADISRAPTLTHMPIWAFIGQDYDVYHIRDMIAAIRAAGGHPRFTEYRNVNHSCWETVAAEPDLLPWLFAQHQP